MKTPLTATAMLEREVSLTVEPASQVNVNVPIAPMVPLKTFKPRLCIVVLDKVLVADKACHVQRLSLNGVGNVVFANLLDVLLSVHERFLVGHNRMQAPVPNATRGEMPLPILFNDGIRDVVAGTCFCQTERHGPQEGRVLEKTFGWIGGPVEMPSVNVRGRIIAGELRVAQEEIVVDESTAGVTADGFVQELPCAEDAIAVSDTRRKELGKGEEEKHEGRKRPQAGNHRGLTVLFVEGGRNRRQGRLKLVRWTPRI